MPAGRRSRTTTQEAPQRVVLDVVLYVAARLLLVALLSAAIDGTARLFGVTDFPLVIAMLFGLVIAMPSGIWLFGPLRRRATAGLDRIGARRRQDREQLRARLSGDPPPG